MVMSAAPSDESPPGFSSRNPVSLKSEPTSAENKTNAAASHPPKSNHVEHLRPPIKRALPMPTSVRKLAHFVSEQVFVGGGSSGVDEKQLELSSVYQVSLESISAVMGLAFIGIRSSFSPPDILLFIMQPTHILLFIMQPTHAPRALSQGNTIHVHHDPPNLVHPGRNHRPTPECSELH